MNQQQAIVGEHTMDDAQAKDSDPPTAEIKQLYRSVYAVAKQLDDYRLTATSPSQLFGRQPKQLRDQLIANIDGLIFQPQVAVGRKSREILWRKGFYEIISFVKRRWASATASSSDVDDADKAFECDEMVRLINEGIAVYRSIVVRMDRYFEMDLRHIMDFASLVVDDEHDGPAEREHGATDNRFSVDLLNYAVETVHAALLSLGDLHRYYIDFNFANHRPMDRQMAARYYHDAFQLNPKLGMAQNQLGTLFLGQRYEMDAVYHYLHSLVSAVPFELSENNVAKIFAANADSLKTIVDDNSTDLSVAHFMARLKLIVDIFFYDKTVKNFNELCHCLLIDLRALLAYRRSQLTNDFLFKVVGIMMLCLTKLSANQSPTVHRLNALLVAICSDLVKSAVDHLEKFMQSRSDQNAQFQETYGALFDLFDRNVRLARKAKRDDTNIVVDAKRSNGNVGQKIRVLHAKRNSLTSESSVESNRRSANEAQSGKSGESRQKPSSKFRRRRRRLTSDDSDNSVLESDDRKSSESDDSKFESEYEMDSDFSSVVDSSEGESDDELEQKEKPNVENHLDITLKASDTKQYSDSEDFIIEEEHLIYRNGTNAVLNNNSIDRLLMSYCKISTEDATLNSKQVDTTVADNGGNVENVESQCSDAATEMLRYKRRYNKCDPNIIIEFVQQDCSLQAIKLLFDWLKINPALLVDCFASNPEFVEQIMRLMNFMNIDMFTRKVCFDRSLVKTTGLRANMDQLFDARASIPLREDLWLRDLPVLATVQQPLDYEGRLQLGISTNEEHLMRLFKLIDFGFFVCKTKQFGYKFCARSRMFVDAASQRSNGCCKSVLVIGRNRYEGDRSQKRANNPRRRKNNEGRARNRPRQLDGYTTRNDENEVKLLSNNSGNKAMSIPKKSYLKNRNHQQQTASESDADVTLIASDVQPSHVGQKVPPPSAAESKSELMGKLWLRNEVKALESEVQGKSSMLITPFLVITALALTDHAAIVKALVKTKKFVVLVPTVVLTELDEMKKNREDARNAIRWLESEISSGSRFLRMQRNYETLSIPFLKTPRKFDRDVFNFLQVAQFCNYMQTSNTDPSCGSPTAVLTLLTGARLSDKKSDSFSYSGIMQAIAVQFEAISTFYAKYKNT